MIFFLISDRWKEHRMSGSRHGNDHRQKQERQDDFDGPVPE